MAVKAFILRRRKLGNGSSRGIKQFSKENIGIVRNDGIIPADADVVFRWGCTSNIPGNPVIVNEAKAIHAVSDKAAFRKLTADKGLAPKTWLSAGDHMEMVGDAIDWHMGPADEDRLKDFPGPDVLVVRRATHHQGRFMDVCKTFGELDAACKKYGEGNYYISEFVNKVAEYRVFIVSGRVVWVARKTPADEKAVAWNVAQGGRFDNVRWDEWPLRAVKAAREAFLLSGLDFGGVDVMVDGVGVPYILEINSAPSQTSPYRQECTAKAFDYIIRNGKKTIPVKEEKGGYKKFIHPAISPDAWMV